MNKEKFEVLKNNLHKAHVCDSQEASEYRAMTASPIWMVQKLQAVGCSDKESHMGAIEQVEYVFNDQSYQSLEELRDCFDDFDEFCSALNDGNAREVVVSYMWMDVAWFITKEEADLHALKYHGNTARAYVKSLHMSHEFKSLLEGVATGQIIHIDS